MRFKASFQILGLLFQAQQNVLCIQQNVLHKKNYLLVYLIIFFMSCNMLGTFIRGTGILIPGPFIHKRHFYKNCSLTKIFTPTLVPMD